MGILIFNGFFSRRKIRQQPKEKRDNRKFFGFDLMENDLQEVATEYDEHCDELTFNSKPIINTLTIVAQENVNAAHVLVPVVEKRIAQV